MINKFYSSLVINSKAFSNVHQVYKPRYNKEFFKRVNNNLGQLEKHIDRRCRHQPLGSVKDQLSTFKEDSLELIKLKDRLESSEKKKSGDESRQTEIKDKLTAIEDRLMPLTISIPNRVSKDVPSQDNVLEQVETNFSASQNLTRVLSHTKLSYINNCYSKSVVGPNSHYYYGIGAKLQHGLSDYFSHHLEKRDFINVSGLCLTKSAVVEASNSRDQKDYMNDPCRILTNEPSYTTLHLVESSRESLIAFISSLGPRSSNNPLRLMTSGAGYRMGSAWFDPDDKRVTQFETLHTLTLNPSIEQYSMKEYQDTTNFVWNLYRNLNLPARLVHCSLDNMFSNEYDSHRIDIWLPSKQKWLQVSRVSHYLDYITIRTGMKRGHMIDSIIYDGQVLFAAIVENNQTSTGKFIIPSVIKNHMTHLNNQEKRDYFHDSENSCNGANQHNQLRSNVLTNFEQRRFLVKKNYRFHHAKKVQVDKSTANPKSLFFMAFVAIIALFGDWDEVYRQYFPEAYKRFYYDYIFRPSRRVWRSITDGSHLDDLPYDEMDHSDQLRTRHERDKEIYEKGRRRFDK